MQTSGIRCAPVVLLAFNRPDKAGRVLEQIRRARPDQLYIGADGPRAGFVDDPQRCEEVRAVVDAAIDWPCEVRRIYRQQNRGCEGNTELTLDTVFAEVPFAIVLDDDCVPDTSFFKFCSSLLERYAHDEQVVHIAGSNDSAAADLFGGRSYAFTAFGSNWGWATWARAWHLHRAGFPRPHDETTKRVPYGGPPHRYMPKAQPRTFTGGSALVTPAARRFFADVGAARDLSLSEWGQQWRLSMLNAGGLAITPAVNLVENVGFAPDSTSGMPTRDMPRADAVSFPLRHPERVAVDPDVERVIERTLVRAVGRVARNLRRRIPPSLREPARRVGARLIR